MTTNRKVIWSVLGLAALVALISITVVALSSNVFGASVNRYEAGVWQFGNGLYAGLSQQFGIDNAGNLTTSGSITASGSVALSGTSVTVNNITDTFSRVSALTAATTTPCSIQSPAATTTLESFAFNVTTGTSSAGTLTLATSTSFNATTSLIASYTIGANNQGTMNWHPGNGNALVVPSTYVNVGVAGVSYGYTYGGTCNAVFRSVN